MDGGIIMQETTSSWQYIIRSWGASVCAAIVVWLFLLIVGAQHLAGTSETFYMVRAGPLELMAISEHGIDGRSIVQFTFAAGAWWYLLLWSSVGCIWGIGLAVYAHQTYRIRGKP
jgi:hypothetical protein